jgi:hypothetical protein
MREQVLRIRIRNSLMDPNSNSDSDPTIFILDCDVHYVSLSHAQVMCALAGGKHLVNLKYIAKSFQAKGWLDPEDPKFLVSNQLTEISR